MTMHLSVLMENTSQAAIVRLIVFKHDNGADLHVDDIYEGSEEGVWRIFAERYDVAQRVGATAYNGDAVGMARFMEPDCLTLREAVEALYNAPMYDAVMPEVQEDPVVAQINLTQAQLDGLIEYMGQHVTDMPGHVAKIHDDLVSGDYITLDPET